MGDGMGDGLHFMGTTLRMSSHTETLTITSYVCVHVCKYIYKNHTSIDSVCVYVHTKNQAWKGYYNPFRKACTIFLVVIQHLTLRLTRTLAHGFL